MPAPDTAHRQAQRCEMPAWVTILQTLMLAALVAMIASGTDHAGGWQTAAAAWFFAAGYLAARLA